MATQNQKPQRSPEEMEDIILRKVLLVTLTEDTKSSADPRILYLEMAAAEILSEGKDLRLSIDLFERVLVDRLTAEIPPSSPLEPPFDYLLNSYRRAHDESKKIASIKDKNLRSRLESVVKQAKKLCVSYCRIHLSDPEMFNNVVSSSSSSSLTSPLLPLIFAAVDGFSSASPPPPGFLEEFFKDCSDFDTLDPILKGLYEDLRGSVLKLSALGNFQQPLRALLFLVSLPAGAKSLVTHRWWIPKGMYLNGRAIEMTSILGPFFHVSALPDRTIFKSQPDVG